MTKKLVVRLKPDGTVDAETFGMTGPECLDYVQILENLLEATTVDSQFTADYSAVATQDSTDNAIEDHN